MIEFEEGEIEAEVTTSVVNTKECYTYKAFAKNIYGDNQWYDMAGYPCMSTQTTYEAFKEQVRVSIVRQARTAPENVLLRFCKIKLE